jgi:chromodomain-helicase-DNA-binding protein 1
LGALPLARASGRAHPLCVRGAQESVVDFFGVGMKAAEVAAHVERMKTLARKVESLRDPAAQFFVDTKALPAVPKWGRSCDWK